MLKNFVKIANLLDQAGHYADADALDDWLYVYADEETADIIEIPQDEKDMLDLVLESLQDSLRPTELEKV